MLYPNTPDRDRARSLRNSQLTADVASGARCAGTDPNGWFRADGEPAAHWAIHRRDLIDYCRQCPVIAECAEQALRYDDRGGNDSRHDLSSTDDHIRGGLTTYQLARIRRHPDHRRSLRSAIQEDHEADEQRASVHQAHRDLTAAALRTPDGSSHSSTYSRSNAQVLDARTALTERRANRRAANGWTAAA